MKNTICRRNFLRGTGHFTLALPYLASLNNSSAFAQNATKPKRLFIFMNPHPARNGLKPANTGRDYALSTVLKPLESKRKQMLVISGLDLKASMAQGGTPHSRSAGNLFTGTNTSSGNPSRGSSISVDQYLAQKIGDQTAFRSLELGLMNEGKSDVQYPFKGPGGTAMLNENDPAKVYERIFGGTFKPDGGAGVTVDGSNEIKTSVLDFVLQDYKRAKSVISIDDRERLDVHISSLRELERQLQASTNNNAPMPSSCQDIKLSPVPNYMDHSNLDVILNQQLDLATMAFACDRTRIVTLNQGCRTGITHPFLEGGDKKLHQISHQNGSGGFLTKIRTYYAKQMAGFVDRLESTDDIDGSKLIDNTMVVWLGELGDAAGTHKHNDFVVTVFGGKNMGIDLNQHKRFAGRSTNDLLTTMLKAMGLQDNSFGAAKYNNGPLDIFT